MRTADSSLPSLSVTGERAGEQTPCRASGASRRRFKAWPVTWDGSAVRIHGAARASGFNGRAVRYDGP
jgi:hypothetical protein